ncbi:hypothetical protein NA56DRAFT_705360 [Hyaloscypha hepaticicola]|uniref:Uncharacterized protein n=1 Tax=Hyaloscypha hepaticicola TaxID=2082293 RepID=A0A2J6Q039_9HELO|nr:hypothetical protein NA56DRAFT_705360 [Hyaloscypha hepaticicola]
MSLHIPPPPSYPAAQTLILTTILTSTTLLLLTYLPPLSIQYICQTLQLLFFTFYFLIFIAIIYSYKNKNYTCFWAHCSSDRNYVRETATSGLIADRGLDLLKFQVRRSALSWLILKLELGTEQRGFEALIENLEFVSLKYEKDTDFCDRVLQPAFHGHISVQIKIRKFDIKEPRARDLILDCFSSLQDISDANFQPHHRTSRALIPTPSPFKRLHLLIFDINSAVISTASYEQNIIAFLSISKA